MSRSKIAKAARSCLALVLRPANPAANLDTYVGELEGGAARAVAAGRRVLGPDANEGVASLAAVADDADRFQAAMAAYGTRAEDLPAMERGAEKRFNLWSALLIVAVVYAIVAPAAGLAGTSNVRLLDWCLPWFFVSAIAAKAAKASYELHVLRSRALVSFRSWLADPAAWLGARASGSTIKTMLALVLVSAALAPVHALAQTGSGSGSGAAAIIGNWTGWAADAAHANDLSLQWMQRLFPGAAWIWGGTPSDADALMPLATLFNSVLLALAGGMLAFHTVLGTVATAHSGKVLGERYHQIWAPIRVCGGFAFLAPIKGYCLAQYTVIAMLMGSYGMTNAMWDLYVQQMLSPTSAATLVGPQFNIGNDVAEQVLRAETCAQVATLWNVQVQQSSLVWRWTAGLFASGNGSPFNIPSTSGATSGSSTVWDYGPLCGSLTIGTFADTVSQVAGAVGTAVNWNDNAGYQQQLAAYQAFDQVRTSALGTLVGAVRSSGLPVALATGVTPGVDAQFQGSTALPTVLAAAGAYNNTLLTAAKTMSASLDAAGRANFLATSQKLGWASAGSLNFTLTQLSAAAADRAAGAVPDVVGVQADRLIGESRSRMDAALGSLDLLIRDSAANGYTASGNVQVREDFQSWNPVSLLMKPAMDMVARNVANLATVDPVNPMGSIVALGNGSLVAGETLFVGYMAARASAVAIASGTNVPIIGNFTSAIPKAAQEVLTAAAPFIDGVISALIIFGAINAYILPMIPYFMWFFAVVACASLAVELVIVAPLAAFFHVRMDGQELIDGPQKAIYTLTFHAITRPPLLLLGLIMSNIVFAVMATYLNQTFALAMVSSAGNGIIGVVGILAMLASILCLHYQLAIRCMALIHQVPSMAAHIMGAPDLQRDEAHETRNVFGSITGGARNTVGSGVAKAFAPKEDPAAAQEKRQNQKDLSEAVKGINEHLGGGKGGPKGNAPQPQEGAPAKPESEGKTED